MSATGIAACIFVAAAATCACGPVVVLRFLVVTTLAWGLGMAALACGLHVALCALGTIAAAWWLARAWTRAA